MKHAAVLVLLATCGCGPASTLVTVRCPVSSARIYVDDRLVGTAVAPRVIALQIGSHRLELRADGYYPVYRDVDLAAGGPALVIDAPLRPVPDGANPF